MATNIPPHNLEEICNAAIHWIDNSEGAITDLVKLVPGPDFPTAGIIYGTAGIRSAYHTGRGIIRVRARMSIEEMEKSDRERLVINELPYQVNKARLVEKIALLVREKKLEGISDLRDESDRNGIRVVLELKKGTMTQVVMNTLYKNTQLQDTFGVIMLALVNQQPKVLNLKEMLYHFVQFRKEVVTRRTQFDLRKAREREHIYEGLKIAVDNIDEVVKLIRAAADPQEAKEGLMGKFGLSEIQAKSILEMRLQRLTGLERQKIIDELTEIRKVIVELEKILAHEEIKMQIIKDELIAIRDKYGDDRRTEIVESEDHEIDVEDTIPDEDAVVIYSRTGYIKRQGLDNYRAQRRGGKGIKGMDLREEDLVESLFIASALSSLLVFTSIGKVHWLKVYQVPDVSRIAKGKAIANLLALKPEEKIARILSVREFEEGKSVMVVTERGVVKKTSLMAYSKPRQGGIIGLTLDEGDRVISAEVCSEKTEVLIATEKGYSIRFDESEVRPMGRTARGVRGIKLREGDRVVGAEIVAPGNTLLTVTNNGYGKRTPLEEYPVQGRGGMGVMTIRSNDKIGLVIGIQQVADDEELLLITSSGNVVRMKVSEVSIFGRGTQGVRLVGVRDNNHVVSIEKLQE
jgi:DNA gyrase subunit A